MLPVRAARAQVLLCPANLAPLALPAQRGRDPRRRGAAPSRVVLARLRGMAAAHPARPGPSRAARRDRIRVLARRAERAARARAGRASPSSPAASTPRSRREPTRTPPAARSSSTGPYVLCVASQTARKNLQALVARSPTEIEVVVAGGHRPQFAREQGLDALRHLGAVPDALLPGLYAGAEAFALPSLYEGFGLPVLEAMACGTPVVAADATALPETAGGAARLVAPEAMRRRRSTALLGDDGGAASGCATAGPRPGGRVHLGADRPRGRRAAQRASRRAARRNTASERAVTSRSPRWRRSPDQSNEFCEPSRESHVYQTTRSIRRRLRAFASSDSASFSRDAWPRSVVTKPGAPWSCPATPATTAR